jgi:hypothetical protein
MEGPVIINNGKTRLKARNSVTIHDSFEVTKGSELIIEGD